jgi:hypothetical protein
MAHAAYSPFLPRAIPTAPLVPDSYITDGRRLLRVVARPEGRFASGFAALEDCMTLEVRSYSLEELAALELRPVRAGSTSA